MTMPNERTRALLWGGSFLIQIAKDKCLPVELRRQAVMIARHFPTIEDVEGMARAHLPMPLPQQYLVDPSEVEWEDGRKPLTWTTRLAWPEDGAG